MQKYPSLKKKRNKKVHIFYFSFLPEPTHTLGISRNRRSVELCCWLPSLFLFFPSWYLTWRLSVPRSKTTKKYEKRRNKYRRRRCEEGEEKRQILCQMGGIPRVTFSAVVFSFFGSSLVGRQCEWPVFSSFPHRLPTRIYFLNSNQNFSEKFEKVFRRKTFPPVSLTLKNVWGDSNSRRPCLSPMWPWFLHLTIAQ